MENENITQEESDALILEEMGLAEENSTINNEESDEEETLEEENQEEEQGQEDGSSKPKKGIAKVLSQRNEARREAEIAKSETQRLQARLEELEADGNYGNEEYIQTLVDKRMAEKEEVSDYFDTNSELKQFKSEILKYSKETGLNIDDSTKLYLAKNNPSLLLEKEILNKQKSKMYGTPAISGKKAVSGKFEYSDKEFKEMADKGLINF